MYKTRVEVKGDKINMTRYIEIGINVDWELIVLGIADKLRMGEKHDEIVKYMGLKESEFIDTE